MRVAVIIISLFGGLVMVDYAVIPMRLIMLISSSERSHEAVGSLVLFALWTVATAFVYAYPGVACWFFALAGGVGIYHSVTKSIEEFPLWGLVAVMLATLTGVASREKRLADQIAWTRAQHELAVHEALRRLQEAVPELLSCSPASEESHPRRIELVKLGPGPEDVREIAHR